MPDMMYVCGIPEAETNLDHDIGGGADNFMPENSSQLRSTSKEPKGKRCKFCGKTGFSWGQSGGSWRLHMEGVLHECDQYRGPVGPSQKRPTHEH